MTLFFLHAPRTGGTALRHAFINMLGEEKVLSLFTRDGPETSPVARRIYFDAHGGLDPHRFDKLSDYIVANGIALFASHQSAVRLKCFDPSRCFMVLRHPVDRIISEYRFVRQARNTDIPFDAFAFDPHRLNMQSRLLSGAALEDLGVVGVFDRYTDFVRRLNHSFGLSLEVHHQNANKISARRFLPFCSARKRQELEQANDLDMALYEHARSLIGAGNAF